MLDDMLDHIAGLEQGPARRPVPDAVREVFRGELDSEPADLAAVHDDFRRLILPYGVGNGHPAFMGWVHGGGTAIGMLAEMLAAGLNANLGGRDQIPLEVERQIARWAAGLFGFPPTASGLFLTGTSMANLAAILVARTAALPQSRVQGVGASGLVGYTSTAAHNCVVRAFEMAGLGSAALRRLPVDSDGRLDLAALEAAIAADRRAGFRPFIVIGSAGTVEIGAIDPLPALARIARREGIWFHVDGAFGALAALSPELAPRLAGIGAADSIAFDFHKWGQVPYDAGFLLVRDAAAHLAAFASEAAYLQRSETGLASNSPWPCDLGPDLSRGFRALKTWFTLRVYGAEALGQAMLNSCRLAAYLAEEVDRRPELERLAPVALNIVCFRYRRRGRPDLDAANRAIVAALQDSGVAVPSTTVIDGKLAIRAAIVNHRTRREHVDALVDAVIALGRAEAA
jgi:aromatic-L-amino-acid decarboxylase